MITIVVNGITFAALEHACRHGEGSLLKAIRFPNRPETLNPQGHYPIELSCETAEKVSEFLADIAADGTQQFYGQIRLSELMARWEKARRGERQSSWSDRLLEAVAAMATITAEVAAAV